MTRDEIISMARASGLVIVPNANPISMQGLVSELERFAALVAAAEREHLHKSAEAYKSVLETAPHQPALSDERILHHLDAILKASGSGLKNYSMHKPIEEMKQALRAVEREILGGAQS